MPGTYCICLQQQALHPSTILLEEKLLLLVKVGGREQRYIRVFFFQHVFCGGGPQIVLRETFLMQSVCEGVRIGYVCIFDKHSGFYKEGKRNNLAQHALLGEPNGERKKVEK